MNRRELLARAAMAGAGSCVQRAARASGMAPEPVPTGPLAKTTHGFVRGTFGDFKPGPSRPMPVVACFKGIPYGMDTAKTRFAPPQPPQPWDHVLLCAHWGHRAPQVGGARSRREDDAAPPAGYHLPPDEGVESEDCLRLNVWTPLLRDGKKRPVLVYIHGGAYSNGTVNSQLYDGSRLARRGDAVVVTVNHRLNAFGYLYLAELLPGLGFDDSGNAGQLDLVLALEWVRENIAEFGGDASRVTIFGQSGGGAKCATLMAQPAARGLFHRVITMSGQQLTGAQPAHATERARNFLKALELDSASTEACAKALRALPMDELQKAAAAGGYFGPVTDGRSLPRDPFAPTDPAISAHVPMMLGNMHDETRGLMGQPAFFHLTWDTLPDALERNAPFLKSERISLPVAQVIARYRAWHPAYSASDVFFAVTTDSRSWRGQIIEADRRAADAIAQPHTWVYQLNWKSPVRTPDGAGSYGSPHTLDIPLAFDNVELAPGMVGGSVADKARAQQMADLVSERFLAFAHSGTPEYRHMPHWPAFDLKRRATMIFDVPARVEDDPRGAERRYLGQVPYVQPGT